MIALPIISIVFCTAYIVFVLFKFGVPVSLSETSYLLDSKWDWMFAAWTVLTSVPFGFYWFTIAAPGLKWIAVVTVMALLMIGVSSFYKSSHEKIPTVIQKGDKITFFEDGEMKEYNTKPETKVKKPFIEWLKEILAKFKPSEFLKYGWARPIHYINSIIAIVLVNVYTIMTVPTYALVFAILLNVMFILIGMKVDGVYNPKFSADVDNKAWIFFMEIISFMELFVFIW